MIRPWSAGSDAESLVPSITERRSSTQSPSGLFGSRLLSKANRRPESPRQIQNYVRERTDGYSKVTNARIDSVLVGRGSGGRAYWARWCEPFTLELLIMIEKSLYERLGGVFAVAAVVDHFSDAVVQNPIVGKTSKNEALRQWHTKNLGRLPGLKFMRTLWVCAAAGGPFSYTATRAGKTNLGLEEAHRDLRISPDEFDEVAAELGRTLDFAKVPQREKAEVLAAFAAHKNEVTAGSMAAVVV